MTREEFICCVDRSQEKLRKFLVGLCSGDRSLADDLAQETFLKAYMACKDIPKDDYSNFNSWIIKIAYNTFLNNIRGRRPKVGIDEIKGVEAEQTTDSGFRYENLYRALDSLGPKDKTMLLLYYMQGYSMKEVAEIVDMKEEAVRQSLSRARKKLKQMLEEI